MSLPETTNSTSENGLVLTAKEPNAIDELVSERDELVRENAALRQENQEMARLLKEYEKGMETTTSLIRDHAVYSLIPFPVDHSLLTSSHLPSPPSFPPRYLLQFNSSIRTSQLHKDYNQKLHLQTLENERLQNSLIDAEAKLIKVSGLLRQAHAADHEADRNVDQALLDLQTQNRGLRMALGLPVETPIDIERDLVFLEGEEGGAGKG